MSTEGGGASFTEVSNSYRCENSSGHDFNSTELAARIIAVSYSTMFYVAVVLISVLGLFCKACVIFLRRAELIFFLIGTLLVSLNVFVNSTDYAFILYQRITSSFLLGIVFVLFGASLFFSKPTSPLVHQLILSKQQPSMGLVVAMITFPLIITELFLILGAQASKRHFLESQYLRMLILIDGTVYLVQKLVQVAAYLFLRTKATRPGYRENAEFYLKVLAFFNFIQWVDSQVNVERDVHMQRAKQVYGAWFNVLITLYKALLIDYRLLCSLLFLEHSIEIKNEGNVTRIAVEEECDLEIRGVVTLADRQRRICGFLIASFCFISPFLIAVFYIQKLHMHPFSHAFATFLNSAIIGVCGMLLLRKNRLDFDEKQKESAGVKMMVCSLGAVGVASLMIKTGLTAFWGIHGSSFERSLHHFQLASAELAARGLTTTFLMVLLLKLNARALPQKNPNVKMNHILVPVMMIGILADFLASLIDQYVGPVDAKLRCEVEDPSLKLLLEVGPPMQLGFLIHVCLHFLIIETNMGHSRVPAVEQQVFCVTS